MTSKQRYVLLKASKDKIIVATMYPEIASYDEKNDIKTLQFDSTLSLTISKLKQVNKWLQWAVKLIATTMNKQLWKQRNHFRKYIN